MPIRFLNKLGVLLLSGTLIVATSVSINHPSVQAEDSAAPTSTNRKVKQQPLSRIGQSTELKRAQTKPVSTPHIAKIIKKSTPPAPIEPFIKADAVALGQWLVVKTVKNLVSKPAANTTQAAEKPKPENKDTPQDKAASSAEVPTTESEAPLEISPDLPKIAVQALPPAPSDTPTIDSYTQMRVALTKQAPDVTVAASEGGALISTSGELIKNLPAGVGYQISADERGLLVNGQPVPTAIWLEPDNGYVAVGNRWYRGRLLLLWQNSGVMAVNYVLLQEYLYSVVGAEMSASWSLEALKAQAVAARSYAIVHTVRHQQRAYDLDDTQRYQAYKGIATEASSTQQAVHETSGEFISYGGGVVESLYAANQAIVDDAHSGYGMSQTGALDLARQGHLYYEILSAYYPNTSVGRIDIDN